MKINLIAIGKSMPEWVTTGYLEYVKRFPNNFQFNLIEINTPKRTQNSDLKKIIDEEGNRMLEVIPKGSMVIALDEHGKNLDTITLAKKLTAWQENYQEISLLIGGPDGLAESCKKRADFTWSLSQLTFPHPLVRIIVAEQIYRAFTILQKHPYHRS